MSKFSDFGFSNVNIFWFLESSIPVTWICLGCGQNKTFEDVSLGFGKQWSTLFTILWHFMDQTTNRLIEKIIDRLINNENNRQFRPYYFSVCVRLPQGSLRHFLAVCSARCYWKPQSSVSTLWRRRRCCSSFLSAFQSLWSNTGYVQIAQHLCANVWT